MASSVRGARGVASLFVIGGLVIGGLALTAACGAGSSGPPASSGPAAPGPRPSGEAAAGAPAAGAPAAPSGCPAPAVIPSVAVTDRSSPARLGSACPPGVCPEYHECGCDDRGRLVFLQHVYGGYPKQRETVRYDEAGRRVEVRSDPEARGYFEARYLYAHAADGSCVVETVDSDFDGVAEQRCTYRGDCLRGTLGCEPLACAPFEMTPRGSWCASPDCPTGARCACDARGRVTELYTTLDADPAFERKIERIFHGDDDRVDEQLRTDLGVLAAREAFTYDARGRTLTHRIDEAGDGSIDREELWTWGEGEDQWLTYDERYRDVALHRERRYTERGELFEETQRTLDQPPSLLRYFPGAPPGVVQPIVLTSWLTASQVACKRDTDCVVVRETNCCGCSSGGTGVVVSRTHAARVRAAARARCGAHPTCPAVISTDASCQADATPACVQGLCTLRYPG